MAGLDTLRSLFGTNKKNIITPTASPIPELTNQESSQETKKNVVDLFRESFINGVFSKDVDSNDTEAVNKMETDKNFVEMRINLMFNEIKRYTSKTIESFKKYGHNVTAQEVIDWSRDDSHITLFGNASRGIGFDPIYEVEDFTSQHLNKDTFPREQLPDLMESFGISFKESPLTSLQDKTEISTYKDFDRYENNEAVAMTRYKMPTNIEGVSFILDFDTKKLTEITNPTYVRFDFSPTFMYQSLSCDNSKGVQDHMSPLSSPIN